MRGSCWFRYVAAAWLIWSSSPLAYPQDRAPKSIHQLEAEAHRDMVIPVSPAPRGLSLLAPSAARNASRTVFGFYPYWGPGFSQIRFQDLTHIAFFSVEANGSGQLVNLRGWPNYPLIQAAHQASVRVVLVCTLFDSNQLQGLLSSAQARQSLVSNLKEQVVLGNADGVNIDFEGVPGSQRANLVLFMKDLAVTLRDALPGADISIDTPAVDWSNAFDYAALADICDTLMIMAYDYHWTGSSSPGPVSPLAGSDVWGKYSVTWTVADYLTKVGSQRSRKLVVGVPYYGYDWPSESDSLNAKALAQATSRTYSAASAAAASYGRRWDNFSSTPWYFYTSQTPHQAWFDDAASLSLKYDLVFQNDLQGIGIWALTYDQGTTELWALIERKFALPQPPEPPTVSAPASFFNTVGLPLAIHERGSIPATGFEVAVGTSLGGKEVSDFKAVGLRHQVLLKDLALKSGATYYVRARSVGQEDVVSAPSDPVAISIDASGSTIHKYLPYWISNSDLCTGLGMVNASQGRRAVWIRSHTPGQMDADTAWVLEPWQQFAKLVSEPDLLGSDVIGKEGWLEIVYQGDGLQAMYLIGDNQVSRSLSGSPLLDAALRQVIPELDGGRTQMYIANTGSESATIQFKLVGTHGQLAARSFTLNNGEMLVTKVDSLFPDFKRLVSPDDLAFIEAESDKPLVGTSTLQRDHDSAAVPVLDATQLRQAGAFSYFVVGGGYRSQAVLINPTNESQTVQLHYSLSGVPAATTVTFAGMGSVMVDLGGLTGDRQVSGAVEVIGSSGSGVLGSIWIRSEDYRIMAALPLESIGSRSYVFPQLAQAQGYWTGISIANPGSVACDVTIEALDTSGSSVGTHTIPNLRPGETTVGLIYEWIRSTLGMSSGTVKVSATAQVLVAEIFGNDALTFMASVPGK